MDTSLESISNCIDFSKRSLWISALFILGSPLTWNVLGRIEYHTLIFTRLFRSKFLGCYFFAVYIWLFSFCRNLHFSLAVADQPSFIDSIPSPWNELILILGYGLYAVGIVLVVTSSWALGVLGTYNGDYFRILMEEKITQFPFSAVPNPMYTGSTMIFYAHAIIHLSPAGFLLSTWVFFCYQLGLLFEEPFTNYIYAEAERAKQKIRQKQTQRLLQQQLIDHIINKAGGEVVRGGKTVDGAVLLDGEEPSSGHQTDAEDQYEYISVDSTEVRRLEEWSIEEVGAWLQSTLDLVQYVPLFKKNDIDGSSLARLDLGMLKNDLQIHSLGHRFKILDAIARERRNNHKKQASNKWSSERRAIEGKVLEAMQSVLFDGLKKKLASLGVRGEDDPTKSAGIVAAPAEGNPPNSSNELESENEFDSDVDGSSPASTHKISSKKSKGKKRSTKKQNH